MSKRLPVKLHVNKWFKDIFNFDESFIKSYNEESGKRCLNSWKLYNLHNNLPFPPERMKIEKVEKLVVNLYDEERYDIHIRNLKQVLNHGLVLRKRTRSYYI